jgi:predicted  nucleic acid-binding Zn-ribbon protein
MTNLKERVAYLQGLTKGLNVSEQSAEGKILVNIIDVLDDMANDFHNMIIAQQDLESYVETIDEDLTDLEEEIYEETYSDEEVEDDDYVEVQCPACHEAVTFESDILAEDDAIEVTCPYCGGIVYDNTLEFDDDMDIESSRVDQSFRHAIHPGV